MGQHPRRLRKKIPYFRRHVATPRMTTLRWEALPALFMFCSLWRTKSIHSLNEPATTSEKARNRTRSESGSERYPLEWLTIPVDRLAHISRSTAWDVSCLPSVWSLRAATGFPFPISSLVLLPSPFCLFSLVLFRIRCIFLIFLLRKSLQRFSLRDILFYTALVVQLRHIVDRRWYGQQAAIIMTLV